MKMTITIDTIRPPGEGKKSALIVTTAGDRLWLWRDKLGLVKAGATYEVIVEDNNGFRNIKTVKEVAGPAAPPASGGAPAARAAFRTPEEMFVSEVLTAYIANGRCDPEKLGPTIRYIRNAWAQTFGGAPITGYREAAE